MKKITLKQIAKAKENPLLKGMPNDLKTEEKFNEVEKKITNIMRSDHKHKTVKAFTKCKRCQKKFHTKRDFILGLGFKSIEQYQMWKKVMDIVINKKELELYVREGK